MVRFRRRLPVVTAVLVAVVGIAVAVYLLTRPPTSLVGTWSHPMAPAASVAPSQRFVIVVDRSEQAGTWQMGPNCSGTLRLKDISNGFHHYYRVAGTNAGCAPPGIDCLERSGDGMTDVFTPNSGKDVAYSFRRVA